MQHHAWLAKMLASAIRRTPAVQWRDNDMRRWFRSGALVLGTALGLVLADAPPAARSAQIESQLSSGTENVIGEITVNAITQRTCGGAVCSCAAGTTLVGGGARCAGRDTLQESAPANATTWTAFCQQLVEIRGGVAATGQLVVLDIQRFTTVAATASVICSTPQTRITQGASGESSRETGGQPSRETPALGRGGCPPAKSCT